MKVFIICFAQAVCATLVTCAFLVLLGLLFENLAASADMQCYGRPVQTIYGIHQGWGS